MTDKINELIARVEAFSSRAADEIEDFRIRMLGKKGAVTELMEEFKAVAPELKREFGQRLNELKTKAQQRVNDLQAEAGAGGGTKIPQAGDMTRPGKGTAEPVGSRHPISLVRNEIVGIFDRMGYIVADGPEIEDDRHVFTALNFAPEHPARDMQDTFFVEKNPDVLLRTHTSSIQVRVMETQKPPIRVICPGRVFRNEAISYRAHCIFHQVEGLYIDEGVSFADLKQTLLHFAREMFGADSKIRPISRSPNRAPKWMCRARSAAAKAAPFARARAGSRSWDAAWSTPTFWSRAASTARDTPDSRSAWASSASRC